MLNVNSEGALTILMETASSQFYNGSFTEADVHEISSGIMNINDLIQVLRNDLGRTNDEGHVSISDGLIIVKSEVNDSYKPILSQIDIGCKVVDIKYNFQLTKQEPNQANLLEILFSKFNKLKADFIKQSSFLNDQLQKQEITIAKQQEEIKQLNEEIYNQKNDSIKTIRELQTQVSESQQQIQSLKYPIPTTQILQLHSNPYPQQLTIQNNRLMSNCGTTWYAIRSKQIEPQGIKSFRFRIIASDELPRPNLMFGVTSVQQNLQKYFDNAASVCIYLASPDIREYSSSKSIVLPDLKVNDTIGMIVDFNLGTVRWTVNDQAVGYLVQIDRTKINNMNSLFLFVDFYKQKEIEFI